MKTLALSSLLAVVIAGCSCDATDSMPEDGPGPSTEEAARFAHATNALGWRVYERLAAERENANVVYSPVSAHLALAMLEAGARGETRDELLAVLSPGGSEVGLQRAASGVLRAWLDPHDDSRAVHTASRVFVDEGAPAREAFEAGLRAHFGARVLALDFRGAPSASGDAIGAWMQEATENPQAAAPSVAAGTRLVIVNHVRFEARWARSFTAHATRQEPFHRANGETVSVPMMWMGEELPYAEVDGAHVVELPYASLRFGLLLVRPTGSATLASLAPSGARLDAWVAALERRRVDLALPRFSVEARTLDLTDHLPALGLARAFDPSRADLGRLVEGDEPVFVGGLLQAIELEVDEDGTRAAATTTISVAAASAFPDRVSVRFDRPFLFVLRDRHSGVALFLGRIEDPSVDAAE